MGRVIPRLCPSCGAGLLARRFECPVCATGVDGAFGLPVLVRLEPAEQEFVLNLLDASGSLKDLAQMYGVSYPTVRNRLDALRAKVKALRAEEQQNTAPETPKETNNDTGNGR